MNKDKYYFEILDLYLEILSKFEKLIDKFGFSIYTINDLEKVYVVEDSFIIYIGIKDYYCDGSTEERAARIEKNSYYSERDVTNAFILVFEELTYNELFKINASKLKRDIGGNPNFMYYKFFNGDIGTPIKDLNFLEKESYDKNLLQWYKSNYDVVNNKFPFFNLYERVKNWKGKPYTFIIYEAKMGEKKGYAVNATMSPYVTKFALNTVRNMEKSIRTGYLAYKSDDFAEINENEKFYIKDNINGYDVYTCTYSLHKDFCGEQICCNDVVFRKNLLFSLKKYYSDNNIDPRKTKILYPHFIQDNVLKYWIFTDFYKKNYLTPKYINIIENIDFYISKCPEAMEYKKADNKWKSEEMVYNCAKKIFYKNEVIHQHRPYFLRTNKGQLSYDIFVCGENIAIEYQGKQHFEPIEYFGGKEKFEEQKKRDQIKKSLSDKNGITLIYVNYWEDISTELIKNKILEASDLNKKFLRKYYLK